MTPEHPAGVEAKEARLNVRPALVIIMGTSGCGKSTLGKQLALRLGFPFVDGDDLHPKSNVEKMTKGQPLNDEDRAPWLEIIRATAARLTTQQSLDPQSDPHRPVALIACSALRRSYRDILRGKGKPEEHEGVQTYFLYLRAPDQLLRDRMASRLNHFMTVAMLDSQLATLEEPQADETGDTLVLDLADEEGQSKNPARVADEGELMLMEFVGIEHLETQPPTPMPPGTPIAPSPQPSSLPSLVDLSSPTTPLTSLTSALSLLLEPSKSLKTDLAPEVQNHLLHDDPPTTQTYSDLLDLCANIVSNWSNEKRADFLGSHPRIGEVKGLSKLSAREQSGTQPTPPEVLAKLEVETE